MKKKQKNSVIQGRVILRNVILIIPLSGRRRKNSTLHMGYISQYTTQGEYKMFWVLGNTLVQ